MILQFTPVHDVCVFFMMLYAHVFRKYVVSLKFVLNRSLNSTRPDYIIDNII